MRSISSSKTTFVASAGASELITNVAISGLHLTISIFSPCNSFTTDWTRLPLMPTQAPTGSIELSDVCTAILALLPGSRATDIISTIPSYISGTSCMNNFAIKLLLVLDRKICGPLGSRLTSWM